MSTAYCAETVESADVYLVAGPTFNDYTTTGWTLLMKDSKVCSGCCRRAVAHICVTAASVRRPSILFTMAERCL